MHLKLNCDGASRGNPGLASTGYVIRDDSDGIIAKGGTFLGVATNNFAEYNAVIEGLERVFALYPDQKIDLDIFLDSKLVVEQMNGHYKVKNPTLLPLFFKIKNLVNEIENVRFQHVPRTYNKLADSEANKVLDSR